jgi:predicted PurR-regulated permease PerM
LASLVLIVAALYWARAVLLPIALAVLLAFLLSPLVRLFQRRGLGRTPAVLLVVVLAFSVLGAIGWVVSVEVASLANEIPNYERNLQRKIAELRQAGQGGFLARLKATFHRATAEPEKQEPPSATPAAPEKPTRVIVEPDPGASGLWQVMPVLAPVLGPIMTAGVVILLVIYMLFKREDLRNRLIQLAGTGRLTFTTRAMDEAGQRISSYLFIKSLTNGGVGLVLTLGLLLIGVPYAAFWAFLTAILRFIPSLGTWLSAIFPAALSLIVFETWWPLLLVLGLYAVVEIGTANVLEPRLYGARIGVSPVALFVALLFWTWLWGPAGLILATPLTVCLAVLGKYVPQLEFLSVLLSDQPALDPEIGYYQRLLAKDQDEAADIAAERLRTLPLEEVYDQLLVPALSYARRDLESGNLAPDDAQFIVATTREIVEDLAIVGQKLTRTEAGAEPASSPETEAAKVPILLCPARDETDEVALLMFCQLLDPATYELEVSTSARLVAEVAALVEQKRPAILCIAALPPGGLAHTRLLCKRLRTRFPELKIVVGRWGLVGNLDRNRQQLLAAGADEVAATFRETRSQMAQVVQLQAHIQG